jgi:hypothetical protein
MPASKCESIPLAHLMQEVPRFFFDVFEKWFCGQETTHFGSPFC